MADFAVIFDMDGVLIDSLPIIHAAFNELLEQDHGIRIEPREMVRWNGKKLADIVDEWNERFNVSIDFDEFLREADDRECELLEARHRPNKALLAFLGSLRKKGIPSIVATSSTGGRVERFLTITDLKREFEHVVTVDDVKRGKPDPELFLTAAERLGVPPEKCIVIEDAPNGIEAARRGGMKAVGVVSEWHTAEELGDADLLIKDFSELNIGILEGFFK